jgi:hypothetical protein
MNNTFHVIQLLAIALVLVSLASLGEITATRQVACERYRFVKVIRVLRRAYDFGLALATAASLAIITAAPGLYVPVAFVAVIGGAMVQIRQLVCGYDRADVLRFGVLPCLTIALVAMNVVTTLDGKPIGLQLGVPALLTAALFGVQCCMVRRYRNHRELLLLVQG